MGIATLNPTYEQPINKNMQIYVDADACPKVIKEILFRAAERRQMPLTLVANKFRRVDKRSASTKLFMKKDAT